MFKKKIAGKNFEIKPINLFDCIEDRHFLPFSLIEKKSDNAYENMMADMGATDPLSPIMDDAIDKYVRRYIYLCKNPIPKEMADFFDKETKALLFNMILATSFKLFKKPMEIPRDTAITLYFMAKSYGKLPIQLIAKEDDFNELDAYIFNYYCLICGRQEEKKGEPKK